MNIPTPVLIKDQTPQQLAELAPWCVVATTTRLEAFDSPLHWFRVCESLHAIREIHAKHKSNPRYAERIYPCVDAQVATAVRQRLLETAATGAKHDCEV